MSIVRRKNLNYYVLDDYGDYGGRVFDFVNFGFFLFSFLEMMDFVKVIKILFNVKLAILYLCYVSISV